MAITNKRATVSENASENLLKNKLKENYKRFLKEGNEDEDNDLDLDLSDDGEVDSTEGGPEDMTDMSSEETPEVMNPIENLTDTESEQVNSWIDELLGDSLETVEIDGDNSLDTELPSDNLDPMGEQEFIHDDLPMTVDDLNNIIDSDDSLAALEKELADLAVAQEDETNLSDDLGSDLNDDTIENPEGSEEIEEAEDPMKGIDKYFEQGYEGEDTKDDLQEDVELAKDNKDMGMEQVAHGLNDKITATVKPTEGARTREDIEKDQKGVVTESIKKSKMLYAAGKIILENKKTMAKDKKTIEALKLENYKLIKANGLLSVAGDMLTKEVRTQISEGFDKCQNMDQINKFYTKLTEKIKTASRPSLNNVINNKKTKINVIKEAKDSNKEKISYEQQRINMLMGLNTPDDAYFS